MKCVICKHGETEEKMTSVTLERGIATFVFKNVPALVCANCGEKYVSDEISAQLLEKAETALRDGVTVDIREFKAA